MSDYLIQIEDAYSRGRGKGSILSPIDWQLADSWHTRKIPLFIVLRSMSDCFENFRRSNPKGTVNTLRYFEQEVEKQFAAWSASRVGSSGNADPSPAAQMDPAEDAIDQLEEIMLKLADVKRSASPELQAMIVRTSEGVYQLIEQLRATPAAEIDLGRSEAYLVRVSDRLGDELLAAVPDSEKASMMKIICRDWPAASVDPVAVRKLMLQQLYCEFALPKLTLFDL